MQTKGQHSDNIGQGRHIHIKETLFLTEFPYVIEGGDLLQFIFMTDSACQCFGHFCYQRLLCVSTNDGDNFNFNTDTDDNNRGTPTENATVTSLPNTQEGLEMPSTPVF